MEKNAQTNIAQKLQDRSSVPITAIYVQTMMGKALFSQVCLSTETGGYPCSLVSGPFLEGGG